MLELVHGDCFEFLPELLPFDVNVFVLSFAERYLEASLIFPSSLLLAFLAVAVLCVFIIFCLSVVSVSVLSIQPKQAVKKVLDDRLVKV
jgi:hypothetical protein